MPGVSKLSTTTVPREFLDAEYTELPSIFGGLRAIQSLCVVMLHGV